MVAQIDAFSLEVLTQIKLNTIQFGLRKIFQDPIIKCRSNFSFKIPNVNFLCLFLLINSLECFVGSSNDGWEIREATSLRALRFIDDIFNAFWKPLNWLSSGEWFEALSWLSKSGEKLCARFYGNSHANQKLLNQILHTSGFCWYWKSLMLSRERQKDLRVNARSGSSFRIH